MSNRTPTLNKGAQALLVMMLVAGGLVLLDFLAETAR